MLMGMCYFLGGLGRTPFRQNEYLRPLNCNCKYNSRSPSGMTTRETTASTTVRLGWERLYIPPFAMRLRRMGHPAPGRGFSRVRVRFTLFSFPAFVLFFLSCTEIGFDF